MWLKKSSFRLFITLLAATILLAPAWSAKASDQSGTEKQDVEAIDLPMSKETAYYTFMEQVGRVQVFITGQLAALEEMQESNEFIPFQIAVGVNGKGPELAVTRQHFILHDANGHTYEAASQEDVQKTGLEMFVRSWVEQNPLNTGYLFETSRRIESDFYPTAPGGITQANLDRETYLVDVVYFPRPEDLHGELMLSFYTAGMDEGAVNVRFKVPEMKKHKKDKENKENKN